MAIALVALGGCGAAAPAIAPPAATPPVAAVTSSVAEPTPIAAAPVATSWTMPNLVGTGLQDAQDAIQTLTSYGIAITKSHDATGAGRRQILDRDWKVCDQNVSPGATITSGTLIDFGAAKLSESC
jgi:hypothetical protein